MKFFTLALLATISGCAWGAPPDAPASGNTFLVCILASCASDQGQAGSLGRAGPPSDSTDQPAPQALESAEPEAEGE
jgi:hypothetical protein